MKKYNIEAAKKLIKRYKSITLEDIEDFDRQCEDFSGYGFLHEEIGFGSEGSCILCREARKLRLEESSRTCNNCIYSIYSEKFTITKQNPIGVPCVDDLYDAIDTCTKPSKLFNLIQQRTQYLEDTLKLIEDSN